MTKNMPLANDIRTARRSAALRSMRLLGSRTQTCPTCGTPFEITSQHPEKQYCKQSCHSKANWETNRKKMVDSSKNSIKKAQKAARSVLMGSHGFGLHERGRPDHHGAKRFIVRSPDGDVFEAVNLAEWCRTNADRFLPDSYPHSRKTLAERAQCGLGKIVMGLESSWRGWTCELLPNAELSDGAPKI